MPKLRKVSSRDPKPTIKIFCEGEKTEPTYIHGYIRQVCRGALKARVNVEMTNKNTPVELVEEAVMVKQSNESLPGDIFWVVYDRESVSDILDKIHADAFRKAKVNGIKIALSNVCFECWLNLHFEYSAAAYLNFNDFKRKSNFNTHLKRETGHSYDKSSKDLFAVFKDRISIARDRAKKINADGMDTSNPGKDQPHQINPYFGVPALLDDIDKLN